MPDESVLMPPPPPRLPPGSAGGPGGGDEKRQQVPPPPPFAGKRRKREQKEEREGQNNQKQREGTMGVGEDSSSSSSSSSRPLGRSAAAEEGRGLRVTASNNGSNIVAAIAGHGGGGVVVDVVAMGAGRSNGCPQQGEDYEQYGALVAPEQQLKPTMATQITAAAATASTALPCYSYHHQQHQQHQQQPGPSSTRSPRCENADSVGGHTGGVENVPPPPQPPPLPMSLPMSMDGMPTMTMYEGNTHGNACDGVQQQQREQHQFPNMSNPPPPPPPPPTGCYGEAAAFIAEQQHQQQGGQDADEEDSATTAQPEIPSTTFADIIGHGQAKLRLDEALLPLALPPDLTDAVLTGVRAAPATILLHGPPGTGKSLLARAVAGESSSPLLTVGPSDVLSKFVGESERSIRQLFDAARMEAARSDSRCCVLFFDEIDSIGGARSGMGGAFGNGGGGGGAMTTSVGGSGGGGDGGSGRRVLAELLIQLTRNFNEVGEEEEDDDVEEDDGSVCSAAMKVDPAGAGAPAPSASSRAISPVPPRSGVSSNDASADVGATSEQDHQQALQHHHQQLELPQKRRQRKPKVRIIVVAATNRPEDCDPALLRRFAVRVFVGPPTRRDRKKILSKFLSDVEHRITPSHLEEIAAATEGWSGSELESLSREAVMAPVRECLRSAALLRAKARKRGQQSGADSGQDSRKPASNHEVARDALIGGFRSLRPVALEDFQAAVHFCLSGEQVGLVHTQDGAFAFQRTSGGHYDSESSSDEEGD